MVGKNLKAIHVHDNNGLKDQHVAPFLGSLDFDSLLRGRIDAGYERDFTFESEGFFKYSRGASDGPLAHPTLEIKKADSRPPFSSGSEKNFRKIFT